MVIAAPPAQRTASPAGARAAALTARDDRNLRSPSGGLTESASHLRLHLADRRARVSPPLFCQRELMEGCLHAQVGAHALQKPLRTRSWAGWLRLRSGLLREASHRRARRLCAVDWCLRAVACSRGGRGVVKASPSWRDRTISGSRQAHFCESTSPQHSKTPPRRCHWSGLILKGMIGAVCVGTAGEDAPSPALPAICSIAESSSGQR